MPAISEQPVYDDSNGWERILPARAPAPALHGTHRAAWLVIGAGLAGLAAARRLAEHRPDQQIALLDASSAGHSSAGRNSGFAIDLAHNVGAQDGASLDNARRVMRLSRGAIAWLDQIRQQHQIECQWSADGQFMPAVSREGEAVLDSIAEQLTALEEPFRRLDREQLADETGTAYYRSSLHTPGTVLLQPAALARGLADTLPENVMLAENSPVTECDFGETVSVRTPAGEIVADKVILAVNGLAPAFGFFRGRLITLRLFASLTEPLGEDQRERFKVQPWGMVPAMAFGGPTLRYTNDHRLLARFEIRYTTRHHDASPAHGRIARIHQQLLRDRFPQLGELSLAHTWSGYITVSGNFAPGFGRLRPNVFSAVCQNGIGLTKGTMAGMLIADLACGEDHELITDLLAFGRPSRLPPRPLLDWGARVNLWRWTRAGRAER